MKLSFTTLGCPEWTCEEIVSRAGSMGYDAIEIRGLLGVMEAEEIDALKPNNLEHTRALLRSAGVSLIGFGSSVRFDDPAAFDAMVESGRRAIDVCARAGIPYLRVFGDRIRREEDTESIAGEVARGISLLCGHAKGSGVTVLQETHGDFNTVRALSGVLEGAGGLPEFGVLWDVAHSDRSYGGAWETFYSLIRPYIRHIHIKDHRREGDDFRLCLPGKGGIPIAAILDRLTADGYEGYYSFEWEKMWHPELEDASVAFPAYIDWMRAWESNAI
jgi:sugar phosphate isomerase/epimerase